MPVSKPVPVTRTWVRSSTPARIEEILDKAAEVLTRDGHAAFNLRKVAAEVGVRLATIQHHFANREALLSATITKAMQGWGQKFQDSARRSGRDPVRRLRALQRLNLDLLDDPLTGPLIVECFALAQHDSSVHAVVSSQYHDYLQFYADQLREIRPDLGNEILMSFATVLAAQIEGLVLLLHRDDPAAPRRAPIQRALACQFDAFIAGFRAYEANGSAPRRQQH